MLEQIKTSKITPVRAPANETALPVKTCVNSFT